MRVLEVRGSKANPYTAGVICNKVMRAFPDFVHGANRLTNPLKRIGPRGSGQFEIICWDKALDLVHEGFTSAIRKYGFLCGYVRLGVRKYAFCMAM